MTNPFGFLQYQREDNPYRAASKRINDWEELQTPLAKSKRQKQAERCMNCGIPYCHMGFYGKQQAVAGCPNENLIPEWNDFLAQGEYRRAFERLSRTNPLPEMTGRVCPAPCEKACTESLNGEGVTIHDNERFIIDAAFENDWVEEIGTPAERTDFKVTVVGSGPAGLSAAWRLNQLGHNVSVFEKNDRFGGLLMYGIPNMKLDKKIIKRRIALMKRLGIQFVNNNEVGKDITADELYQQFDRIILAIGAAVPRDLNIPKRDLLGIYFAGDFLTDITKKVLAAKGKVKKILAGKKVVVIGGGDTGNDCIATSVRLGAKSVKQLEITPRLEKMRKADNPWPEYPMVDKQGYGQEEAKELYQEEITEYSTSTTAFIGSKKGEVIGVEVVHVDENFQPTSGTKKVIKADVVLLAMGFLGAEQAVFKQFEVQEIFDNYKTNNERVYVAGDAKRGPSLVIWAIREGRKAAEKVDKALRVMQS
ncbi:MAG: glutamate synthase subunit beta [Lactobacillales bacterium]|jgi:glutamate synthase (NADPH/NADH) small chain|nr:glutamate synthase subunit beta [Lactobacillales bacterium]